MRRKKNALTRLQMKINNYDEMLGSHFKEDNYILVKYEVLNEKFDIIISTPPYIPLNQKQNLQTEVKFDPELALFTKDENGLEFYEKIIPQAKNVLNSGGYLLFEMGVNQSQDIKKLLEINNYSEIEIIKDLANIERVIVARLEL